jgi:integrative and conjugative element protein (TIGR02256 family)
MLDLIFQNPEMRVVVHEEVIEQMKTFRQIRADAVEACGILLGRQYDQAIEVTDITTPQRTDMRTRVGFKRERKGHVDLAVSKWKESNGLIGYLGEWHTHPEHVPTPSLKDLHGMTILAKRNRMPILLIILGYDMGCCTIVQPGIKVPLHRFALH